MYRLTCTGTQEGTGVAVSCAKVALSEPGSININRNPIGVVEFQGGVKLSLLISLSRCRFYLFGWGAFKRKVAAG